MRRTINRYGRALLLDYDTNRLEMFLSLTRNFGGTSKNLRQPSGMVGQNRSSLFSEGRLVWISGSSLNLCRIRSFYGQDYECHARNRSHAKENPSVGDAFLRNGGHSVPFPDADFPAPEMMSCQIYSDHLSEPPFPIYDRSRLIYLENPYLRATLIKLERPHPKRFLAFEKEVMSD